ncbi:lipase family protein [Chryseobacterium sp.]|uniref:lipase family protein n=1 Tax=Chryseobacterium sp. TaxID=1871047 RepID=UPI0031D07445
MFGQKLNPGFNKEEYIELLKVNAKIGESERFKDFPYPQTFKMVYRSPEVGFANMWELWLRPDNVAVISIRGTTVEKSSWLANLYEGMAKAKGSIKLSGKDTFSYDLSNNPKAGVHAGWLISMGFLANDILPKIDSCYKSGIKDFFIVGHSQGGAISYLLTAYLNTLRKNRRIEKDIQFKTYCSAAPKPGNLYFAYEYEKVTMDGWAYNVVNSSDWVPEVPISIQTLGDLNIVNPIENANGLIRKVKFPKNIILSRVFHHLNKTTQKASLTYQKFLGKKLEEKVTERFNGFELPELLPSFNYVRTGNIIVLEGDDDYFKHYPKQTDKIMEHHNPYAYLFLANKLN